MKRFHNEKVLKAGKKRKISALCALVVTILSIVLFNVSEGFVLVLFPAFIWLIVAGIQALTYGMLSKQLSDEEVAAIDAELDAAGTVYLPKTKVYLTEHFIVSMGAFFFASRYTDILWIYPYKYTFWFVIPVYSSLKVYFKKNCGVYDVAHAFVNTAKIKEEKEQIWNMVAAKGDNVVLGYGREGMEAAQAYRKSFKEAKKAAKKAQ